MGLEVDLEHLSPVWYSFALQLSRVLSGKVWWMNEVAQVLNVNCQQSDKSEFWTHNPWLIFQKSLDTGKLPLSRLQANIAPIVKKGDRS